MSVWVYLNKYICCCSWFLEYVLRACNSQVFYISRFFNFVGFLIICDQILSLVVWVIYVLISNYVSKELNFFFSSDFYVHFQVFQLCRFFIFIYFSILYAFKVSENEDFHWYIVFEIMGTISELSSIIYCNLIYLKLLWFFDPDYWFEKLSQVDLYQSNMLLSWMILAELYYY